MKKLLQLLIVAATFNVSAQTLPVPTNGLVAFYGLDGNSNDGSGNNNNLNNSAITASPDRFNTTSNSMCFSGTGSTCLYLTDGSPLNIINSNITVSFWYKTTNGSYAGIIDNSQAATANGWGIDNFNGRFRFLGAGNLTGPTYATDGTWHHIVFVKSGSKGIFYKDNIATDSTNSMTTLTAPTAIVQFNIGRRNNITSYLQSTNLDDIAIYNRALTRQEIADITTYNGFVPEPPISVPVNGLIAHYPFTNSSLQDFNSFSSSKTLSNSGAVSSLDRFNNTLSSYTFDGSNALTLANGSMLGINGASISVSFWYKTTSANYAGFIDDSQAATANGYGIDNNAGSFRFLGGGNFSATMFNPDGQWHHVVFVKSGTFGAFYNDGVLVNWANTMSNLTAPTSAVAFKIGSRNNGTGGFIGDIDDVSIYNRPLFASEISQMYNYNNWSNTTTGINEKDNSKNIAIYPNPSNGLFILETLNTSDKMAKLQVVNTIGEIVLEKIMENELETIDLRELSNGVYFVKINSNKNSVTKKIIKQ